MCSQNQRVRPGKFMRMPDFLLFAASAWLRPDCRRNCCGVVGVQKELETHQVIWSPRFWGPGNLVQIL